MKRALPTIVIMLLAAGCASTPLPQTEREITIIKETSATKSQAYDRAQVYLAKVIMDSNDAVKVRSPENGQIVSRIMLECNELRGFADITSYNATFNLDLQAKDKKVRMIFEGIGIMQKNIDGKIIGERPFSRKGEIENARTCAEREADEILKAINGSDAKDNW